MNHWDVDSSLATLTLLVDTREQPTQRFEKRMERVGFPYERMKLDCGDYSAKVVTPDGIVHEFDDIFVIERKMNIDELCMCFGTDRKRFEREFERAKEKGCKIYLLVENATWEMVYNHQYRSKMTPQALIASINAFRARYNAQLDFCKEETTPLLIHDILYREAKEYLTELED